MKFRFFAVVAALILSLALFTLTACNPDSNPPGGEVPGDDTDKYVSMTFEEFDLEAQNFTNLENYSNVQGYKLSAEADVDDNALDNPVKYKLGAIFDLSDFEDIAISATFACEGSDNEQIPSKVNAYHYSGALYVDMTRGGEVKKDSFKCKSINLADIIKRLISSEESAVPSLPEIPSLPDLSLPGFDMSEISEIDYDAYIEYFKDYTSISYCASKGIYKVEVDHSEEGVLDENTVPVFKLTASITVVNNRMTLLTADFRSDKVNATCELKEYSGSIDYPDSPDTYNGDLLDGLEEIYVNRDLDKSNFYGTWTGEVTEDTEVHSYNLVISEEGATLTIDETLIEFTTMESYSNYMALISGENSYVAKLDIADNNLILMTMDAQTGELVVATLGRATVN